MFSDLLGSMDNAGGRLVVFCGVNVETVLSFESGALRASSAMKGIMMYEARCSILIAVVKVTGIGQVFESRGR